MSTKTILFTIIAIVILAAAGWYIYSMMGQPANPESNDSTAAIQAELNSTPSDTQANTEMNSLDQAVGGF